MEVLIPTFSDLVDIFIIAFLFYQGLCVLRRGGGWHILAAIVFLVVLSTVAEALNLRMVTSMLNAVRNFWVLALVIIFQPELRALHRQMTQTLARGARRSPEQKPRRTRAS